MEPTVQAEEIPIRILAYPNPARGNVTISWEHPEPQRIRVWGASGRTVYDATGKFGQVQLNTDRWSPGLYFVRVNDATAKLVVQR